MSPRPRHARKAQEQEHPRWNRLSDYFFSRFGAKVKKIPLDAGFSCPNRDGAISTQGCIFCNEQGSGTGLGLAGLSLAGQWQERTAPQLAKGFTLFMAYLQSFSNTYGPIEKLTAVLEELKGLPGLVGLSVGTRPDCVDAGKLALIAGVCEEQAWPERWLELGVQSSKDATLKRINRGHGKAEAETAIALAQQAGLKVCVHLIAGLPGERKEDFLESVAWASAQPVSGVKFHALYVCKGTALAEMFHKGEYRPLTQEEYVEAVADALPLLRQDVVVQRISGDPAPGELLAPAWAERSRDTSNRILTELAKRNSCQGKDCLARAR